MCTVPTTYYDTNTSQKRPVTPANRRLAWCIIKRKWKEHRRESNRHACHMFNGFGWQQTSVLPFRAVWNCPNYKKWLLMRTVIFLDVVVFLLWLLKSKQSSGQRSRIIRSFSISKGNESQISRDAATSAEVQQYRGKTCLCREYSS
jgi:hypothetical protein